MLRSIFAFSALSLAAALASADVSLVGSSYCRSAPSSVGVPAELQVLSLNKHAGDNQQVHLGDALLITAWPLPEGVAGFVLGGPIAQQTPFGGGTLCLGAPFARIAQGTAASGYFAEMFELQQLQAQGLPLIPGIEWHFQVVFQDPAASTFNLTDAVRVTLIQ